MSKSVLAIQLGYDYQSLLFWSKICDLFLPHTKTVLVEYEVDDVKSFDDVVVTYSVPNLDGGGSRSKDFFQAKFHSHNTAPILHTSLTDPAYIGATTNSFLQKLLNAHRSKLGSGERFGYHLYSPSSVHPDDVLSPIWSRQDGRLNLDRFFEGKTDRSAMWVLRNEWKNHLAIDDEELREIVSAMSIVQGPDIVRFREELNIRLHLAGLRPIDKNKLSSEYDDLVRKLHATGVSMSFTRDTIKEIAEQHGMWVGESHGYPKEKTLGIRSFMRYAEEMPNLTHDMVCLTPHFEGRHLRPGSTWDEDVKKEVSDFLEKYQASDETFYLLLETHISIAFAAGMSVEPRSPARFVPVQKSEFRRPEVWSITGDRTDGDTWRIDSMAAGGKADELIVGFSVTHSVWNDVKDFADRSIRAAQSLAFEILPRPGNDSIRDGNHAFTLAQEACEEIVRKVKSDGIKSVHVFAAAPTAFMFYLGLLLRLPRSCSLAIYEYDFGSKELGAYTRGISFNEPLQGE